MTKHTNRILPVCAAGATLAAAPFVHMRRGVVAVKDRARGRKVLVCAGDSYLARRRGER